MLSSQLEFSTSWPRPPPPAVGQDSQLKIVPHINQPETTRRTKMKAARAEISAHFGPTTTVLSYITCIHLFCFLIGSGLLRLSNRSPPPPPSSETLALRLSQRLEAVTRSPMYSQLSETLDGLVTIRAFRTQSEFVLSLAPANSLKSRLRRERYANGCCSLYS